MRYPLVSTLVSMMTAVSWSAESPEIRAAAPATRPVTPVGQLEHRALGECSGVVASRRHPGVFWVHNDSDCAPVLYAVTREGKSIADFPVAAVNEDWEDIAIDDQGHLYIGDTGNNGGKKRELTVYRVDEPDPRAAARQGPLKVHSAWRLRFPDGAFDCESLFVHRGYGYVITKGFSGARAVLYRFSLELPGTPETLHVLEKVAVLPIRSPVTAADVSADGHRLAVLTVTGLNLFDLPDDLKALSRVQPGYIRYIHPNAEACCFVPDGVLVITERRDILLFSEDALPEERPAPPLRLPLRQLEHRPAVDGELGEWQDARLELPLRVSHRNAADPPAAQAWGGWNQQGIYLAVRVPAEGVSPLFEAWFAGDAVEIFLGREGPERPAEYVEGDDRCYVGFARGRDGSCGSLELRWPRDPDQPRGTAAAGRLCPAPEGGYQFEVFLPASLLEYRQLAAGTAVRMDVSILLRQPRANWYIGSSNAAGCWTSPLKWAIFDLRP